MFLNVTIWFCWLLYFVINGCLTHSIILNKVQNVLCSFIMIPDLILESIHQGCFLVKAKKQGCHIFSKIFQNALSASLLPNPIFNPRTFAASTFSFIFEKNSIDGFLLKLVSLGPWVLADWLERLPCAQLRLSCRQTQAQGVKVGVFGPRAPSATVSLSSLRRLKEDKKK